MALLACRHPPRRPLPPPNSARVREPSSRRPSARRRLGVLRDLSQRSRSFPLMSCVPVTPEMAYLLEACRSWPFNDEVLADLRQCRNGDQAQRGVGSCVPDASPGMGAGHAGPIPKRDRPRLIS